MEILHLGATFLLLVIRQQKNVPSVSYQQAWVSAQLASLDLSPNISSMGQPTMGLLDSGDWMHLRNLIS